MGVKSTNKLKKMLDARGVRSVVSATVGFFLLFVIFSLLSSSFRTANNIQNLLRQIAPTLIIGIGQGYVLITGNIDLSIGSVVGMSAMTAGTLMTNGVDPVIATLITLLMALAVGIINGVLVARLNLHHLRHIRHNDSGRGLAQLLITTAILTLLVIRHRNSGCSLLR